MGMKEITVHTLMMVETKNADPSEKLVISFLLIEPLLCRVRVDGHSKFFEKSNMLVVTTEGDHPLQFGFGANCEERTMPIQVARELYQGILRDTRFFVPSFSPHTEKVFVERSLYVTT
jgi:hypothetical protein